MNVYEKLLYIQQNLKAPKGQYNSFGDYRYRSCEDIQEALKPLLAEVKAVLLLNDEIVQIGDRFYIKATACLQDAESTEKVTNTAYARETDTNPKMDAAQITGSCSSYARKYALNGLFCIDDAKDPDAMPNADSGQVPSKGRGQQAKKTALSTEYQDEIKAEAVRTGTDLKKVCSRYKVQSIADLSIEQYRRAMSAFRKMESVPPPQPEDNWQDVEMYANDVPFR